MKKKKIVEKYEPFVHLSFALEVAYLGDFKIFMYAEDSYDWLTSKEDLEYLYSKLPLQYQSLITKDARKAHIFIDIQKYKMNDILLFNPSIPDKIGIVKLELEKPDICIMLFDSYLKSGGYADSYDTVVAIGNTYANMKGKHCIAVEDFALGLNWARYAYKKYDLDYRTMEVIRNMMYECEDLEMAKNRIFQMMK